MRDDDGSPVALASRAGPRWLAHAVAGLVLAAMFGPFHAPPASAQNLSGAVELQFQSLDRSRSLPIRDSWAKIVQMDYANHLPGAIELSSNFRFVEQTVARESERVRVPEGRLRLAHRNFGLLAGYRPTESRDSRGFITRQRELTLMGNAQREGLPSLAGSWVRSRLVPTAVSPGNATVARSLSSQYSVPWASFRAGYGDRLLEDRSTLKPRVSESHVSLGSSSQFQVGRAPVSLRYDFSQANATPSLGRSQRSRAHVAGASSSFAINPRTSTGISYNYRGTQIVGGPRPVDQEHSGGLSLSHTLNSVVQLAGGAGMRSATVGGARQTERFVAATASAQGEARPGWRLASSATHSENWLPGAPGRPADNFQSSTTMRLARGLDLRGDFSIATAKPVIIPPDTIAFPRQVALQSGAGITASPLRSVHVDANVSHSRASARLFGGGPSANSYSTGLRITPYAELQLGGRWGLIEARGSRASTAQGSLQWAMFPSLQVSGAYSRSRQEFSTTPARFATLQESLSGSLTMVLARDLNASVQYTESNRGQPNRIRQLTVNVVRRFAS